MNSDIVLSAGSVTKTFLQGNRQIKVLSGVDLEVRAGARTAIVGLSGSGKSTLLHILGGLEQPDEGSVAVCGESLSDAPGSRIDRIRNRHLGFIYQFHHLLADFSALENVTMPLLIRGENRTAAMAGASDLLEQVGLSDRMEHRPGQLSGGERQRVAIARALVGQPSCVLADEPTGNLDEATAEGVNELMLTLSDSLQTAFVVVTHNAELAAKMDRTLTLHNGILDGE